MVRANHFEECLSKIPELYRTHTAHPRKLVHVARMACRDFGKRAVREDQECGDFSLARQAQAQLLEGAQEWSVSGTTVRAVTLSRHRSFRATVGR